MCQGSTLYFLRLAYGTVIVTWVNYRSANNAHETISLLRRTHKSEKGNIKQSWNQQRFPIPAGRTLISYMRKPGIIHGTREAVLVNILSTLSCLGIISSSLMVVWVPLVFLSHRWAIICVLEVPSTPEERLTGTGILREENRMLRFPLIRLYIPVNDGLTLEHIQQSIFLYNYFLTIWEDEILWEKSHIILECIIKMIF